MDYQALELDLGGAALLFTRFHGEAHDADLESWLKDHEQWMRTVAAAPRPLLQMFDLRRAPLVSASQRKLLADWVREHGELLHQTTVAFAAVVPSAAMRGMLTAIHWISPLPVPTNTSASLEDCMTFLRQQCDARGIDVPSAKCQAAMAQCEADAARAS